MARIKFYGQGPTVVLLHGCPVGASTMKPIADGLANDYRVALVDYAKLGKSPEAIADHLTEHLHNAGVERAAIVGHSYGAYQALLMALNDEIELTGLLLIGALAYFPDEVRQGHIQLATALEQGALTVDVLAETLLDTWFSPTDLGERRDERLSQVREWLDDFSTDELVTAVRVELQCSDLRPRLSELDLPTHLIVGDVDGTTPLAFSQEIHSAIPSSTIDTIEGVGHFPQFEAPQRTIDSLRGKILNLRSRQMA